MFLSKTLFVPAALVATVLYVGDPYAPENAKLHPYLPPLPENTDAHLDQLRDVVASVDESVRTQTLWRDFVNHELTKDVLAWSSETSARIGGRATARTRARRGARPGRTRPARRAGCRARGPGR